MHYPQTISAFIENIVLNNIDNHRDLLVAYSGGIDSTVLLHVLVSLKKQVLPDLQLKATYIDHGISPNADSWARHCRAQCHLWDIDCMIEKVNVILKQGNIEANARTARYTAIANQMTPKMALCSAQHLDDQCETFLLALKRGSGPRGLSAMPAISQFGDNVLLRPLLTVSRQHIEQYAKENNLNWVEDESNQDDHYDRNFLRLKVLPRLSKRWTHFNQMVARSATLCQQQEQLLNELLTETLQQLIDEQKSLLIAPLLEMSFIKRNALLRMWFRLHWVGMPSSKQLETLWQTVALAREDSNPQWLLADRQVRRYQGRLYLLPQYQTLQSIKLFWDLKHPLSLPDHLGVLSVQTGGDCRLPQTYERITIRFCAQGQFNIVGRKGSRQLKKLWQELNIPPWRRTRIPLVFYNDTLITAVKVFVTEQGQGDDIGFAVDTL